MPLEEEIVKNATRFLAFVNLFALAAIGVGFLISLNITGSVESNGKWELFLWWPLTWWQTVLVGGGWFALALTPIVMAVLKGLRRSFRFCATLTGLTPILSVLFF